MINLEVWVPSDTNVIDIMEGYDVKDCGAIAPPGRFYCEDSFCTEGVFSPVYCNSTCAVLLTSHVGDTNFVVKHILELRLFVMVVWVGPNLGWLVDSLTTRYLSSGRSLVFLSQEPSVVTLWGSDKFTSVTFPSCSIQSGIGCKYELQRLIKLAWSRLEQGAKPAYEALQKMSFSHQNYIDLLNGYEKENGAVDKAACDWLTYNSASWQQWIPTSDEKNVLLIGGIFPMSSSNYLAKGIVRAAQMAVDAVNSNDTVLRDYNLKLQVNNGECKTENVMSTFIQYILFNIHVYLQLLKRLGWEQVAALTEDGQKYTEYISHMQDYLQSNGITFVANRKFPRNREKGNMSKYLEELKNKKVHIIIADMFDDAARDVMCQAYHLKMTAHEGYVWFLPLWLAPDWYDADHYNYTQCTTQQMISNRYAALCKAKNVTESNYAGYAYDAVWTFALALNKLAREDESYLSDIHSEITTKRLVEEMEATDFYGVSGRIRFMGASRVSDINVMQWLNKTTRIVGSFYPNVLDLNLSSIVWLSADGRKPSDGKEPLPRCILDGLATLLGTSCEVAIVTVNVVGFGLLGLVLIIAFIVMKRRYDRKVEQTQIYMKSLGLDLLAAHNLNNLDKWEVPRDRVVINRNMEEKLDFLSEAEVMKRFDHKNIVKLLGVCTKTEPVYTIMEFMLYGDLKTFLLARRHLVNHRIAEESDEISSKKLTMMALDVARALSYLAELKYVHREGLIRSCWNFDHKKRPHVSEIVEFMANNPQLISPCLDVPLASVQIEDNSQLDIAIPNVTFRKCSASMNFSPTDGPYAKEPLLPSTSGKYSEMTPDGRNAVTLL
ncbi:hypothetical protein C0J52_02008 [Blattella germanica]|nr:hypothetical protein C0J52_02008 [Blattella germanica]